MNELINAASIARVTNKAGKFLGFLVKSNHTEEYYQVTCTKIAGECVWGCTCKAGQFGFQHGYCCHIKACQEVCKARKEARKAVAEAEQIVAQAPVVAAPEPAQTVQDAMIAEATQKAYQAWESSVWNSNYCSTNNKAPAKATIKRAPQFANMDALKALPLNGNQGFSLLA